MLSKNFVCNEIVPYLEGHSGFPCLSNNTGVILSEYFAICVDVCKNVTLPHFVLFFPMDRVVSSVHFNAAIIVRRSVFRKFFLSHRLSISHKFRAVSVRYKLPNTTKRMRLGTRNPLHRLLRRNIGSYSKSTCAHLFQLNNQRPMYLRDTQRKTEG